jgi:hypothetical protein
VDGEAFGSVALVLPAPFPCRRFKRDHAVCGAGGVDEIAAELRRTFDRAFALVRPAEGAGLRIHRVEATVVRTDVDLPARGIEARNAVDATRDRHYPVELPGFG